MTYSIQFKLPSNGFKTIHSFVSDSIEDALVYAHGWKDRNVHGIFTKVHFKDGKEYQIDQNVFLYNESQDLKLNLI